MSETRRASNDRGGEKEVDDLLREAGVRLLPRLSAVIRSGHVYDVDNQAFVQQLDSFVAAIEPVLMKCGEVTLVMVEIDLYLNGVRVPVKSTNFQFVKAVMHEFRVREIAGFQIQCGASRANLQKFFDLFRQKDRYRGSELLEACLDQDTGDMLPVLHASVDAPEDGDGAVGSERWASGVREGVETAGGTTGASTQPGGTRSIRVEGNKPVVDGAGGSELARAVGGGQGVSGSRSTAEAAIASRVTAEKNPAEGQRSVAWSHRTVRKRYSVAVQGARWLLTSTTVHGGIQLRHAKRVVQPLVDAALEEELPVMGLSTLSHHDSYTYAHAVNVCILAVAMGRYLRLDRRALADIGVAALLHDVGRSRNRAPTAFGVSATGPHEFVPVERHPIEGVKLLARSTTLNLTTVRAMRVALEHHRAPDGSGYPPRVNARPTSLLSRVISVADCFASLQAQQRPNGSLMSPYEALQTMLGPLSAVFDLSALWALVQAVGFYPPGQVVELDDHSLALVLAPNASDLSRPHVRVIASPAGDLIPTDQAVEFHPLPSEGAVLRALGVDEYPVEPADLEGSEPSAAETEQESLPPAPDTSAPERAA